MITPNNLLALTAPAPPRENPESAGLQAPSAAADGSFEIDDAVPANFGLKEIKAAHE